MIKTSVLAQAMVQMRPRQPRRLAGVQQQSPRRDMEGLGRVPEPCRQLPRCGLILRLCTNGLLCATSGTKLRNLKAELPVWRLVAISLHVRQWPNHHNNGPHPFRAASGRGCQSQARLCRHRMGMCSVQLCGRPLLTLMTQVRGPQRHDARGPCRPHSWKAALPGTTTRIGTIGTSEFQ